MNGTQHVGRDTVVTLGGKSGDHQTDRLKECRRWSLVMASLSVSRVVCAACERHVADLNCLACVQDTYGAHLVTALAHLSDNVEQIRPHPKGVRSPSKRGKLHCVCGENMGNIQNWGNIHNYLPGVDLLEWRDEVALLKFANVRFTIETEVIPVLSGSLLGKAVTLSQKGAGRDRCPRVSVSVSSITPAHVLLAAGRSSASVDSIVACVVASANNADPAGAATSAGSTAGSGVTPTPNSGLSPMVKIDDVRNLQAQETTDAVAKAMALLRVDNASTPNPNPNSAVQLNSHGLPLRPKGMACKYWLNHRSCKYVTPTRDWGWGQG